jgi:hypothetical protein
MSKHTPGPWHCHEIVGVYASNGKLVASIHTPISNRSYDAEVIAAAPDLLEALKNLLESHYNGNVINADCRDAEAAIAKAEGLNKATGEQA